MNRISELGTHPIIWGLIITFLGFVINGVRGAAQALVIFGIAVFVVAIISWLMTSLWKTTLGELS